MKQTSKSAYMKDHDCRSCLYYETCSHESCRYDGSRLYYETPSKPGKEKKAKAKTSEEEK